MDLEKITAAWRSERLGLMMIIASLVVIAITVSLLFYYQINADNAALRTQGLQLTRLLAQTPYRQITSQSGDHSTLELIALGRQDSSLAYLVISDVDGKLVDEITAPGVIYPADSTPQMYPERLGERHLNLANGLRAISEFYAPLTSNGRPTGKRLGTIQIGFFTPNPGMKMEQLPFLATLALPIFLLAPFFIFLIRREFKPLKNIDRYMDAFDSASKPPALTIDATGELGQIIARFNLFMEGTQHRILELESDRTHLETTSKLLTYKRSRIETVLQSIPDGVMVLDGSGSVSIANGRISQMLALDTQDLLGKKPAEWAADEEVVAFLSSYEGNGRSGTHNSNVEFHPKNAPDKTLSISSFPLFSPKDEARIFGTLVLLRDTSQEALTKQASSDFVAHVSHELKSPLNVLAMYSESLQGEDGKDEKFRIEAANVIHDEVERLSMMINNILNITKIEMGSISIERTRVRLRDLLKDAFDACNRDAKEKDLTFTLDLPKEISPIALDKSLIRIVVNNLLTNAIKYSKQQGQVLLSAEETHRTILITVRDDGIGIAPEDQSKIFEKFYRSDSDEVRKRPGHGLGLSLAREIVQMHHGTLTVNSSVGEGSEFVIEFSKETSLLRKAS